MNSTTTDHPGTEHQHRAHTPRSTPPSAFGEPPVWLMGASLAVCLGGVLLILVMTAGAGLATLWPRPVERITTRDGEVFLAMPMGSERYTPDQAQRQRIDAHSENDSTGPTEGKAERFRFRLGNRDLGREPFRWVPGSEITARERPEDAVVVERDAWGVFIGVPRAVIRREEITEPISEPFAERVEVRTPRGPVRAEQRIIEEGPETRRIRRDVYLAEGADDTLAVIDALWDASRERLETIRRLHRVRIPAIQDRLTALKWAERRVRRAGPARPMGPFWGWAVGGCVISVIGVVAAVKKIRRPIARQGVVLSLVLLALGTGLYGVLERPRPGMNEQEASARLESIAAQRERLEAERDEVLKQIRQLQAEDDTVRIEIVDPGLGRFAPVAQTQPDEPMRLSQAHRIVRINTLGSAGRLGLYLRRWGDFLSRPPGESPGDGGIFPVIVGTVVLTLLLTVSVVPLGVVAAIYLREYARQGFVTSMIRIAINNLAGVPSIVYGMFGLGFFCYTLGSYIDGGPGASALHPAPWWALLAGLGLVVMLAGMLGMAASSAGGGAGGGAKRSGRVIRFITAGLWLGAVGLGVYLVWRTPYFHGFFAEKLPEQPTFGGRGILWAALTLALLTLPVVIVATEEAIAAVPGSMREGSLGCGASRWQTIRRIVLPASLPGVLTGAILAMARGAGEVAPLMLVGAVNLAPASPVTAEWPFLHGDRTFMHLGFHIYNLGFQSPDAEAARPMVWTTTLVLVTMVLGLNLIAMAIRARLQNNRGTAVV